jgi:hypothetical protein
MPWTAQWRRNRCRTGRAQRCRRWSRCTPTARGPGRPSRSTAAFDATDAAALGQFFAGLPAPVDHVMVTGPGPYYGSLPDLDRERAHRDFDDHIWLAVEVARLSVGRVRPGGTLLFMAWHRWP